MHSIKINSLKHKTVSSESGHSLILQCDCGVVYSSIYPKQLRNNNSLSTLGVRRIKHMIVVFKEIHTDHSAKKKYLCDKNEIMYLSIEDIKADHFLW